MQVSGSISLLVKFLVSPDVEPLSGFDFNRNLAPFHSKDYHYRNSVPFQKDLPHPCPRCMEVDRASREGDFCAVPRGISIFHPIR